MIRNISVWQKTKNIERFCLFFLYHCSWTYLCFIVSSYSSLFFFFFCSFLCSTLDDEGTNLRQQKLDRQVSLWCSHSSDKRGKTNQSQQDRFIIKSCYCSISQLRVKTHCGFCYLPKGLSDEMVCASSAQKENNTLGGLEPLPTLSLSFSINVFSTGIFL